MSHLMHREANTPAHADATTHRRLLDAAAHAFATRGYNCTSVEEVCSEAGVDARTFAQHFTDRYDLFRSVVFATTRSLLKATDGIESNDPRQARTTLQRLIDSSVKVTIDTRATGGFYRSEYRYLSPEDSEVLRAQIGELRRRIREPLMLLRPLLSEEEANLLAAASQSVIASITIHPTSLPAPKLQTLLGVTAMRLLLSEPAEPDSCRAMAASPVGWQSDTSERGRLMAAAIDLCFTRGYRDVTMADVAQRAELPEHTALSHYASLSDLLTAACLNGYDALRLDLEVASSSNITPRDTLLALSRAYSRHYFADYKLMTIYLADARNFDDDNRAAMLELQDESVVRFTAALLDVRPELSKVEATFLTFASMSLVSDLGRLIRWNGDPVLMSKIEKCASIVMALIR